MSKLSNKILMVFASIILTGSLIMVVTINITTKAGYRSFIDDNEQLFANSLIPALSDYYRINGTWNGVDKLLQLPRPRMGTGMERGRRVFETPEFIITDTYGTPVFERTSPWIEKKEIKDIKKFGIKITVDNRTVGYLLLNPYSNPRLTKTEKEFLNNVTKIIIIVSILILAVSIIFTYILSKYLTKPIRDLSEAANKVENGDYSSRVITKGNDELSELAKSFNSMATSIESNDKWRKQIIADSAHELRTPVTLIQGNLELILEGVYKADKKSIETIYNETVTLSKLIKELQELSSAESGSMKLNIQEIDTKELILSTVESFKADCDKKKIELTQNISENLTTIIGDWQKLKQVLANIVSNALRYTPDNGSIIISANKNKNRTIIEIKDSGIGIEKDDLDKIFERFYRTDRSRNRNSGGSGLGLSISKEIIKMHNGKIHAESEIGKFTKVVIELPS